MHCFAGGPDGGGIQLSPKSYHRILRASNWDGFLSQSLASHRGRGLSACARLREEGMETHGKLWLFRPLPTTGQDSSQRPETLLYDFILGPLL